MIKPSQIFRSADPTGPSIRIKVVGNPITMHGLWGYGTVQVVTLTTDGREVRQRSVKCSQLHARALTRDGQPRRTGYILEGGQ